MTHEDLIRFMSGWMQQNHDCKVVICEEGEQFGEEADCFGWSIQGRVSVMAECKVSRQDFLADRSKPHRVEPKTSVGNLRFYVCPKGLIRPLELPNRWGLIFVWGEGENYDLVEDALFQESDRTKECVLLSRALNRATERPSSPKARDRFSDDEALRTAVWTRVNGQNQMIYCSDLVLDIEGLRRPGESVSKAADRLADEVGRGLIPGVEVGGRKPRPFLVPCG